MPTLEIQHVSGAFETRRLTKRQPLSVGRHPSNDICIDDDGVAMLHCRISWNKSTFEITAASKEGVEVNGTFVRSTALKGGDVIRIGPLDIVFTDADPDVHDSPGRKQSDLGSGSPDAEEFTGPEQRASKRGSPVSEEILLSPLSDEQIPDRRDSPVVDESSLSTSPKGKPQNPEADDERSKRKRRTVAKKTQKNSGDGGSADEPDVLDVSEIIEEESRELEIHEVLDDGESLWDPDDNSEFGKRRDSPKTRESASTAGSLRERLKTRPRRPGEEEVLRSPFALGLGGGLLILVLTAATMWFMIGREAAERQYEAAQSELDQGKYTQAIRLFENFLEQYPKHELSESALLELGFAQIERHIKGATPAWSRGLEALEQFIQRHQDFSYFPDQHPKLSEYAGEIALGAAKTAEIAKDPELLEISANANAILTRYSPIDSPPVRLLEQIQTATHRAEAAILKQNVFDAAIAEIDKALEDKQPMLALKARRQLLDRYQDFAANRTLAQRLQQTLEVERELVIRDELNQEAQTQQRNAANSAALTLVQHTRARTDEVSRGRSVYALAKDCCYAIDTVTGAPVWRRVIGMDTPFFPIRVSTTVPGLLLFDTNHNELLLLHQQTGELVWRQELPDSVSGEPLIHESQVYATTRNGHLYRIILETGQITSRLRFSQSVVAPPVLVSDDNHIVVAGNEAVFYTLSLRPLECRLVSFLDQKPGAIEAPLLRMGALVLMAENDRINRCKLRVIETSPIDERLKEVASANVEGHVRNPLVLRGRQLFVPSTSQRITAFTVSDADDQPPLTLVARFQERSEHAGPMNLAAGPDNQLWMASNALRKFRLLTDSFQTDPQQVARGISSQPLQMLGEDLFVGRRQPYSDAVFFSQADRHKLESKWRVVLGAKVLECAETASGSLFCLTDVGDSSIVSPSELESGGIKTSSGSALNIPEGLAEPLQAARLSDGRIAVSSGMPSPRLWLLGPQGQVLQEVEFDHPLEAAPVVLAGGWVLPLPGRLQWLDRQGRRGAVEDYLVPTGGERTPQWSMLAPVDDQQLLAVDDQGKLVRIQYREEPVPHLAEVAKLQFDNPLDVPIAVDQGRFFIADAERNLRAIEVSGMEPLAESLLDAPATNALWLEENRLYVETGRNRLNCYDVEQQLELRWNRPLNGHSLAGRPVMWNRSLVVADQSGEVWMLDPENGEVKHRFSIGQPIERGPRLVGQRLFVVAIGGSLHLLTPESEAAE